MSSILRRKFLASSAAVLGVFSLNQNIAAEPVKEQAKKDNSEKFDFVVIGAGAAGLAAAIEAKQAGASTVLLEKAPRPDGNTMYASGTLCAFGSREQKGLGDTLEKFVNDQMHETQGMGDRDAIEAFALESGPAIDWLIDIGTPLKLKKDLPHPKLSRQFYMTTDGTTGGSILMRRMLAVAKKIGLPIHVNTKAYELITNDDGRVIGVKTRSPNGFKIYWAEKGVMIATGGFSANEEMRTMYMGPWAANLKIRGSLRNTGENIMMTRPLGAKLVNMTEFYAGPIVPETHANPARVSNSAYGMIVGKDGKRCVDESLGQAMRSKLLPQVTPDNRTFIICDIKTNDEDNILTKLLDRFKRLNSPVYEANTIEELADKAGINKANLVNSVKEFNKAISEGKGPSLVPPHNRKKAHPIATAPFYAIPMSGGIAATFGGPKINKHAQVVDVDDKPIPGLYAAGNASGGLWYAEDIAGSQISSGIAMGRIGARHAINTAK